MLVRKRHARPLSDEKQECTGGGSGEYTCSSPDFASGNRPISGFEGRSLKKYYDISTGCLHLGSTKIIGADM
jgi:hypothetical protein